MYKLLACQEMIIFFVALEFFNFLKLFSLETSDLQYESIQL